jgi:hypothetical protein
LDIYEAAAHKLADIIGEEGNLATVVRKNDEPLKIEITYRKFRFDKNEFRQIVTKKAEILFEENGGQVLISGPQNEDVNGWLQNLIAYVQEVVDDPLQIDEVSLEKEISPKIRTSFFTDLIKSIKGFSFFDVSDVYLHQPKGEQDDIKDLVSEDNFGEEEAPEEESEGESTPDVHISRAALRGQGVLMSKQTSDLLDQGFYIARIVWTAKNNSFDSDLYEFEAQFSEPDTCTMFSYVAKGFYSYSGSGEYSSARSQFTKLEDVRLGRLIEEAAHGVIKKLRGV